jgi:uracil-DNA glycosylase family 4
VSGGPVPPRDVSWYGDPRDHGARCGECPLNGSRYVPYSGPTGKLRLVLVGEGPGRKEAVERRPFVGMTGQLLNEELERVRLDRDETHVTNATLCMPETDQDADRAAECCAPRLLKELAELPPDVPIVTLGKAATRTVLGVKSILLARGFVWTARDLEASVKGAEGALRKAERLEKKVEEARLRLDVLRGRHALAGRTVLPTLHPTFAFIHNETWAPIFHIDLDRVARWVRGELTHDMLADNIKLVESVSALKRSKRAFMVTDKVEDIDRVSKLLGPVVACDIETERQKPLSPLLVPILTVQISDGVRGIVIAPWRKELHADALTQFLSNRTVIFHNGFCFDTVALERDGVSFAQVKLEDTLSAHHSFASQYPQKLDHVVASFLDSSPWKVKFGVRGAEEKGLAPTHVEGNELWEYGAADAFVTKLAWDAMQADLAGESSVYAHDKRRAILYKSLQVVGYPVDRRRKRLLSKKLKLRAAALKGKMRSISRRPNFAPSKLNDVRHVLFKVLNAPILNPTPSGLASTSNATLESLRNDDGTRVSRFSETLLHWRATLKSKNTYVDPVVVHKDGRAHYTFKPFGVITGRPASRILSAPRWSKALPERVREQYCAAPGRTLVYFDLAQAEARTAAALSGDPNFLAAVAGDIHTRNAIILFPDAKEALERDPKGKHCARHSEKGSSKAACNCGKPFRDVTKNVFFAIIYQAHPSTVLSYLRSQGFPIELGDVELMFSAVRDAYNVYDQYVKDNIRWVEKNGYLRTALIGRIIWLGFHPKPAEVSNLGVQSLIADVMDMRLLDVIIPQLPSDVFMIMHHYDSATFDTPLSLVEYKTNAKGDKLPCGPVVELIEKCWEEPVRLKESIVCRAACEFLLPAETKVARRWSAL